MSTIVGKAQLLRELHQAPEILTLVNVWDVASARVVAGADGTRALATASHSVAAAHGFPDGERIPLDTMLAAIKRIVDDTDLPVTADLEAGYGDPGETTRRAIGIGVVGSNLEDQMKPFADSVAAVEAVSSAAEAEGVPFALNARTDAFLRAGDRSPAEVVAEAIKRGQAYLTAGATCVFVPGRLDEPTVRALVAALGSQRISLIAVPGSLPISRMQELGVARVSVGPWSHRVALTALADATRALLGGGSLPAGVRVFS